MSGELERVLAMVASGQLSPEAAEPLVEALTTPPRTAGDDDATRAWTVGSDRPAGTGAGTDLPPGVDAGRPSDPPPWSARQSGQAEPVAPSRAVRILVTDAGRQVVNLRIPMSLASLAGSLVPGLPEPQLARLQQAIRNGERGTILDVRDEDGSGVRIATE